MARERSGDWGPGAGKGHGRADGILQGQRVRGWEGGGDPLCQRSDSRTAREWDTGWHGDTEGHGDRERGNRGMEGHGNRDMEGHRIRNRDTDGVEQGHRGAEEQGHGGTQE